MRSAIGNSLSQQVFQLAHLVATEEANAGEVVALDIEIDTQLL